METVSSSRPSSPAAPSPAESQGGATDSAPTGMGKGSSAKETKVAAGPARKTIDDCIRDLDINQSPSPHSWVNDPNGDTYVYLDPPPQQPGQSDHHYSTSCRDSSKPFVMRSEKLAASTLLKAMLGPSEQHRILRRRKLVGSLPRGIKYVVDVTPPPEGDDAVYLTASLSCSLGVRFWYRAADEFGVSETLVGRPEDQALEYSPSRHQKAIEYCLAALTGRHIHLNAAPLVWSISILIEYFGITCTYLVDCILTWLRAEPNSYFLEVNQEESLRIGAILQNSDLTRDVFALLVGEEALECTVRSRTGAPPSNCSVLGRRKEVLADVWHDRVQYATKAFLQSHHKEVEDLFANDLKWVDKIFETQVTEGLMQDATIVPDYQILLQALKNYVQVMLYACLLDGAGYFWGRKLPEFVQGTFQQDRISAYSELFPTERTLTRNFWEKLKCESALFRDPDYVTNRWAMSESFRSDPLIMTLSTQAYDNANRSALNEIIQKGQRQLYVNQVSAESAIEDDLNKTSALHVEAISESRKNDLLEFEGFPLIDDELDDQEPAAIGRSNDLQQKQNYHDTSLGHQVDSRSSAARQATLRPAPNSTLAMFAGAFKNRRSSRVFFSLEDFWCRVDHFLVNFAEAKLASADMDHRAPHGLNKILTCLGDSEWKYLPLWADGLDDGTGAIYTDDVMEAAPGSDFSTPGPSIHTGSSTWSSSSRAESDVDMMSDAASCDTETINYSTEVADGHSDQMFRRKVYTTSGSSRASSLDDVDRELGRKAEEERAKLVVRTLENAQNVQRTKEEGGHDGEGKGKRKRVQEDDASYDDIFTEDTRVEDEGNDDNDDDHDGYASDVTERAEFEADRLDDFDDDDGVLV